MGKKANPAVVGGFVVGAVVLAVVAVALFGSGRLLRTTYPYVLFFTGDVNGLNVGAPVKLKGVAVGRVARVMLNVSETSAIDAAKARGEASNLRIPVIIEFDDDSFTQHGGRLKPTEDTIKTLIGLGLRGRLGTESFVTGILYIDLDLFPDSEALYVADASVAYPEIPTLPTPLEEVRMEALKFLARLEDIDIKGLVDSMAKAVSGLDRLVNSPDLHAAMKKLPHSMTKLDATLEDASATMASLRGLAGGLERQVEPTLQSVQQTANSARDALLAARGTLESVSSVLEPDSALLQQFGQSLHDLSIATVAVRRLAEEIEQNPSVLLRGKDLSEDAQ